jgi:hypothetical protein
MSGPIEFHFLLTDEGPSPSGTPPAGQQPAPPGAPNYQSDSPPSRPPSAESQAFTAAPRARVDPIDYIPAGWGDQASRGGDGGRRIGGGGSAEMKMPPEDDIRAYVEKVIAQEKVERDAAIAAAREAAERQAQIDKFTAKAQNEYERQTGQAPPEVQAAEYDEVIAADTMLARALMDLRLELEKSREKAAYANAREELTGQEAPSALPARDQWDVREQAEYDLAQKQHKDRERAAYANAREDLTGEAPPDVIATPEARRQVAAEESIANGGEFDALAGVAHSAGMHGIGGGLRAVGQLQRAFNQYGKWQKLQAERAGGEGKVEPTERAGGDAELEPATVRGVNVSEADAEGIPEALPAALVRRARLKVQVQPKVLALPKALVSRRAWLALSAARP